MVEASIGHLISTVGHLVHKKGKWIRGIRMNVRSCCSVECVFQKDSEWRGRTQVEGQQLIVIQTNKPSKLKQKVSDTVHGPRAAMVYKTGSYPQRESTHDSEGHTGAC